MMSSHGKASPFQDESAMILVAMQKALEFKNMMRRFQVLTWDDIDDIITFDVFDADKQERLFQLARAQRAKDIAPYRVGNLDIEIRKAVSQSFHIVDRTSGLTGLGSMLFDYEGGGAKSWNVYNPRILTANFREGQFGRISGLPRKGKTNLACAMLEQWVSDGNVAFTNIRPKEEQEVYFYCDSAKHLFSNVGQLGPEEKWMFILDEGGLVYSKADAATRRNKDLDKLAKVIGKLHGNFVIIDQRPDSIPTTIQEFATSLFYCDAPGIVQFDLRGPEVTFKEKVRGFPKTKLPFDTYDIAFFKVDVDIVNLLEYISGEDDTKDAMMRWMRQAFPEDYPPPSVEVVETPKKRKR